jgi:hypothetical protein
MATLTTVNAVLMLAVNNIFPVPQQLQGFAADDVTDVEGIETSEAVMGVDGILSAGFVYVPVRQNITLQADSASNALFDLWYTTQRQVQDLFFASGIIVLPGLGTQWVMNKGTLTQYKPVPDVKKISQPRKFQITWQSVIPTVVI